MAQKQTERLPVPPSETTLACPLLYAPTNSYGLGPFEVLMQIPIQLENTVCVSLPRRQREALLTGGQPLLQAKRPAGQTWCGCSGMGKLWPGEAVHRRSACPDIFSLSQVVQHKGQGTA